ncbi:MAG: hypothetical protein ABIU77_24695 [Ferruginibacter sp.]
MATINSLQQSTFVFKSLFSIAYTDLAYIKYDWSYKNIIIFMSVAPTDFYNHNKMTKAPYRHSRDGLTRYSFLSTGRRPVKKIVEFTPLHFNNLYNLGFGDLLAGGKIDDKVNSNNGDIIKVLSTVIHIVRDFTEANPEAKIAFKGSSTERTLLYQRILKTYFNTFKKEFLITALEGPVSQPGETVFDPDYKGIYLAFFVKRKS